MRFIATFAVPLCRPYNGIGVMVDDDRDVLMAFLITGLVNADIYKIVQPPGTFRINVVQGTADTPSYGLPVNAHIFGHGVAWEISCRPWDGKVEVLRISAVWVCPRNICNQNAVEGTLNAVGIAFHFDKHTAPVPSRHAVFFRAGRMACSVYGRKDSHLHAGSLKKRAGLI